MDMHVRRPLCCNLTKKPYLPRCLQATSLAGSRVCGLYVAGLDISVGMLVYSRQYIDEESKKKHIWSFVYLMSSIFVTTVHQSNNRSAGLEIPYPIVQDIEYTLHLDPRYSRRGGFKLSKEG